MIFTTMFAMRAIFLDKDGTLIRDVAFNTDLSHIKLTPYAMTGLKRMAGAGFKFIVITNQGGVALGLLNESELTEVRRHLERLFKKNGLILEGFYYCAHHPEAKIRRYKRNCLCRKPKPGLVLRAAREHGIDLERSWFIGDILDDIECGRRAGCRTILMDNGGETEWKISSIRRPHAVARNLKEAAGIITGS